MTPEADPIAAAWERLRENAPTTAALALIEDVTPDHPRFAQAQHVRGVCAMRDGDPERARALCLDAILRGESTMLSWLNLARAAAASGMPDDILRRLERVLRRMEAPKLFPFVVQLLKALGFSTSRSSPHDDVVFRRIALPVLSMLLERRQMDDAIALESQIYETFVKSRETEAHFASSMAQIGPLFTKAAEQWRRELPALPQPSLEPPYRIGFFLHNASMLAHIEVLLNTLKGYRKLDEQPFEPIVYCFGGKSREMEQAFAALNVRLVMLNEAFPETAGSKWQRLLRLRELLARDGVQEIVWVSLVVILPLAFGLRLAPVQTWWAMKYRSFSDPNIDGYVTGSALTRYATIDGRRWRMGRLGVDDWYDPSQAAPAAVLRDAFPGKVILMTLGRGEKMRDPAYLAAIGRILTEHPQAVFLWAGRTESPQVTEAFRAAGVIERTRFIGWVNTRLYAQVADVFLDTFPFPCGFTLFQAMAAGKPVVVYNSPEASQTGLWSFLRPLVEGGDGTPEERDELRAIVGDAEDPLIPVARSPDDYVRYAGRFIADPAARVAGGEAARRFMARYFSDPLAMGSSFAGHFVELIEERRAAGPA